MRADKGQERRIQGKRICLYDQVEFEYRNNKKKYCSESCRAKHQRELDAALSIG